MAPSTAWAQPRVQRLLQRLEQKQQFQQQQQYKPQETALPEIDGLDPWLRRLHELVPQSAAYYASFDHEGLVTAASAVEAWVAQWVQIAAGRTIDEQIGIVGRLHDVKSSIDRQLDNVLALRVEFSALVADQQRHEALRRYLQTANTLIDLSGRLRFLLVDGVEDAAFRTAQQPIFRGRLIDLLAEKQSSVGAQEMSMALFDPPASVPDAPPPLTPPEKFELIKIIVASGNFEFVDDLASFLLNTKTPPPLALAAAQAIRELGLPQDPRPGQAESLPKPAITAQQMRDHLQQIDPTRLSLSERARLDELLGWLANRIKHGLNGDSFRLGSFRVRPGDWLLMRNPSPYNLFTDLSPGLFTHVGVVALEAGSDGKQRMVIVDLPERGTTMPATNVEAFLDRTLHYVFLRHPDSAVGQTMGETATAFIGNPTEFDLNFRTDRVAAIKGKSLRGEKIHTYCAGFLLLCSQETGRPRETFFPITETTAAGQTKSNLAKLGLSLGEGFISPTGALFAPQLELVGRSEPMYDPGREVEEAIFDHFAGCMEHNELQPSPNAFQSLRLKMAEASKNNPLLAKALAASASVSEDMDLVSAAKAAAVVETLDEIAYGASGEFLRAREAIVEGIPTEVGERSASATQREATVQLRNRHADLVARWENRQLSPRRLRIELVKYYIERGKTQIDERFFGGDR
ncbi:MAG: hypothetical protein IT427_02285 [Pirellulales bacterium]|nr:hypothetical protein [Pirellulales bacterium]